MDLVELIRRLESGDFADMDEAYRAIHTLGHHEIRPDGRLVVEKFLRHTDALLRRISLSVLTLHWMCQEHRRTCEEIIEAELTEEEEDADLRMTAITGLGVLLDGTRDLPAMRRLATVVKDPGEDIWTREAAYQAILSIQGVPPQNHPAFYDEADLKRKIDWTLVDRLAKSGPT